MGSDSRQLTRRERQIMDILYRLKGASASEIHERLPTPPTYSTVRKLLSILEQKGYVRHVEQGRHYVFSPIETQDKVRRSALKHLLQTFFENSSESVVAALMDMRNTHLTHEELERIARLIEKKRKEKG